MSRDRREFEPGDVAAIHLGTVNIRLMNLGRKILDRRSGDGSIGGSLAVMLLGWLCRVRAGFRFSDPRLAFSAEMAYDSGFPPCRGPSSQQSVRAMPKQKTHKGMKKRYKLTANGKVKHRKAFRGHLLSSKSSSRKRHLRQDAIVVGVLAKVVQNGLRPSM